MDELSKFCQTIKSKLGIEEKLSIDQAREIVKSINNWLRGKCPWMETYPPSQIS